MSPRRLLPTLEPFMGVISTVDEQVDGSRFTVDGFVKAFPRAVSDHGRHTIVLGNPLKSPISRRTFVFSHKSVSLDHGYTTGPSDHRITRNKNPREREMELASEQRRRKKEASKQRPKKIKSGVSTTRHAASSSSSSRSTCGNLAR